MKKVLYILGELSDLDTDWLAANGRKDTLNAGACLTQEGKMTESLYIVLEGSFAVVLLSRGEKELARVGIGEIVGEISLVDGRPASATVRALEKSVVLSIARKKLDAKLKQDSAFAGRFYRAVALFLSERLRRTTTLAAYAEKRPAAAEDKDDLVEGTLLDNLHLAGARFDRMLKKLMGT